MRAPSTPRRGGGEGRGRKGERAVERNEHARAATISGLDAEGEGGESKTRERERIQRAGRKGGNKTSRREFHSRRMTIFWNCSATTTLNPYCIFIAFFGEMFSFSTREKRGGELFASLEFWRGATAGNKHYVAHTLVRRFFSLVGTLLIRQLLCSLPRGRRA